MSNPSKNLLIRLSVVMLFAVLSPVGALAGGLTMYEVGTADVGLAAAGYAARANDPGTILTNPAGMTRLKGTQFELGAQVLYGHANFSPDNHTTVSGSDGGNAIGLLPGLSAFYTTAITSDLTIGFGMFSNFGLGLWYDSDWVGRYYAKQAILMGMSFMPAAAYRINDQISVGLAANIMFGYLKETVAINNVLDSRADGQLYLKDTTLGIGANVGFLYEPSKGTRFGVTYSSPVDLNFSATPEFSGTGPVLTEILTARGLNSANLNLGITVPQAVMTSFYHEFTDQWAVLGNFGWQNWSQFGKVDVSLDSTNPRSLTTNLKYNDTWHGALGGQYRVSEPWTITGGVAYDSGMLSEANRSPALPLSWSWRFATGAQYAMRKDIQIGFAYEYLYSGTVPLDVSRGPLAGRVSGSYPNSSIQFLATNVTWKF